MNQYWITSLILVECLKTLRVELMIAKNRKETVEIHKWNRSFFKIYPIFVLRLEK